MLASSSEVLVAHATIYNPNAGGDVPANVDVADDGVYVFDERGRRLQHWPYAEIANAFTSGAVTVLIRRDRPEIRLRIDEAALYDAIATRSPQLRRRSLISFAMLWGAVPEEAQIAVIVFVVVGLPVLLYSLVAGWLH
jgi:hypothetical protein